jgi:hypothetical protein
MHGSAGLGVILIVSLLLGLRHASDPDHLAAVTTLIASEEERARVRMAGSMGLSWGLGHGTTLAVLGLPLVLFGSYMPEPLQRTTEVIVGTVIIFLAVRLLHRWWRKFYHSHGVGSYRSLPHSYAESPSYDHQPGTSLRSGLSSYSIGLVHGTGGSGGLSLMLLSTIPDKAQAAGALLIFAAGSAISMALLSTAFGLAIAGGPAAKNYKQVVPVLGCLSMALGAWYVLGALGLVTYPF